MNANHRIVWLDIAKGIAICLMVLGHTRIFFGSWQGDICSGGFFPNSHYVAQSFLSNAKHIEISGFYACFNSDSIP